ncbi:hypothetical protein [Streptomyces uncialis]|uniref:hypothetical protein n=1 Tax=Streptomyces uncialis TaxID=1048205 RepID=UPI0038675464|nr:hypothetical protein OG924_33180 [Streptomyces uncialis]
MTEADGVEQVTAAWARIEQWLSEHASLTRRMLRPPADERAIRDAEDRIGVAFPPALRALYASHDGINEAGHYADYPHDTVPPDPADPYWVHENASCFLPGGFGWLPLGAAVGTAGSAFDPEVGPRIPFLADLTDACMYGIWVDGDGNLGTWGDAMPLQDLGFTLTQYLTSAADALEGDEPAIGREGIEDARPFISPTGDGLRWLDQDAPEIIDDHEADGWRPA